MPTTRLVIELARARGFEHCAEQHAVFRGWRSGFTVEALESIARELGYERLDLALRCTGKLTWRVDEWARRTPDARA